MIINLICYVVVVVVLQTITGAMSTLNPPIQLENPAHQFRVDYIQDVASQPDFDYPPVSSLAPAFINHPPTHLVTRTHPSLLGFPAFNSKLHRSGSLSGIAQFPPSSRLLAVE